MDLRALRGILIVRAVYVYNQQNAAAAATHADLVGNHSDVSITYIFYKNRLNVSVLLYRQEH